MKRIHITAPFGGPLDVDDQEGNHVSIYEMCDRDFRVVRTTHDELVLEEIQGEAS